MECHSTVTCVRCLWKTQGACSESGAYSIDVRPIPCYSVGPIKSHTQQSYTSSPRSADSATHERNSFCGHRNNERIFAREIWQSGTVAQQHNVMHRDGSGVKSLSIVIDTQSLLHIQPFRCRSNKNLGWSWIFTVAVRAINRSIHDEIRRVQDNVVPPRLLPRLRDGRQEISEQLHAALLALL